MSLIRLLLVYEMKTRSMLMKDHPMVMIKFHVWDELFLKLIKYTIYRAIIILYVLVFISKQQP